MAAAAAVEELKTAPYDHRFPSQNQARHCFTAYNEHARCLGQAAAAGLDPASEEVEAKCGAFARAYRSLCPSEW